MLNSPGHFTLVSSFHCSSWKTCGSHGLVTWLRCPQLIRAADAHPAFVGPLPLNTWTFLLGCMLLIFRAMVIGGGVLLPVAFGLSAPCHPHESSLFVNLFTCFCLFYFVSLLWDPSDVDAPSALSAPLF